MQTILGSGGTIGVELAKALKKYSSDIRLVSRNPVKVNVDDQLVSADLTNPQEVMNAVKDSKIAYLTVGLPYSTKIWRNSWPDLMKNVIEACKTHHTKLVFFDNIYMYDPDYLASMNEETPNRPVSKKGQVRCHVANMLLDEIAKGNLKALVARSADFYGPSIKGTSVLTETVFKNLKSGKRPMWLESLNFKHSYTYTPDAGEATALLGNTEDAYNQVWHLPTATNPLTGREWVEAIASEMKVDKKPLVLPKWMIRLLGIFVPVMGEMAEMLYQYDRDYIFDSSKFQKRFDFTPTSYAEGIKQIVKTDY